MSILNLENSPEMLVGLYSELLNKNTIRVGVYGADALSVLQINNFTFAETYTMGGSNVEVDISYTKLDVLGLSVGSSSPTPTIDNKMTLIFLSPNGDQDWDTAFKNRLFKSNPPISVALDLKRGRVFLVFVAQDSLELQLFTDFQEGELEEIVEGLSANEPYKLTLSNKVLMKMVTQEEGYNYARANIQILLNTVMGVSIHASKVFKV